MGEKIQRSLTVAIMSPGAMGHAIGRIVLKRYNSGIRIITNLTGRSSRTRHLSESAGIIDVGSDTELVQQADIVLSIVTTWEAISVAKRISQTEHKNPNLLFVELNDLAPETVMSIAALFPTGRFVDGSILGGPPQDDGYSPSIYLSGEYAHELSFLKDSCNLDIRIIGTKIGDASGLKMCYAPMFKGFTAMAIDACITAKILGLTDVFLDEVKHSLPDMFEKICQWIPGVAPRANRWVGEMDEIIKTYDVAGVSTKMLEGAADTYKLIAESTTVGIDNNTDQTLDDIIQKLVDALKTLKGSN
ncbi:unnamed protein product [Adineta steineri]|uniref:Phosphogluconate dehydrogenase NAD-binding putative C-terminal domain-containing protein n=1 Tax=Adineta steineri TaxID=433720 RepID=A0A819QUA8_9BILA|nr:unnamed protein product [Adineta steineri]CAF4030917.1 unnamed protein product [Adineta steineri]